MRKKHKKIPKNEFRYNYNTKHPAYIFLEDNNKYKSLGLTHKAKTFNKDNMPLNINPNVKDSNKSYIRNGIISDKKNNYGEILDYIFLCESDFKNVKSKIRNYKNKVRKK